MLGLFGIFGRSYELQRLDQALLGVGLHPRLVPKAVKLTTLKLLGEAGAGPHPASYAAAAGLLGYCVLGAQGFTECNDPSLTEAVEVRLAAAHPVPGKHGFVGSIAPWQPVSAETLYPA